jgi:protein-L-isoaspartate(D-aspartate) O-methyltransferase
LEPGIARAHDINREAAILSRHADVKPDADDARARLAKLASRYATAHQTPGGAVPPEFDRAIAHDTALARVARGIREAVWPGVVRRLDPFFAHDSLSRFREAFVAVPRERFVLPVDIPRAAEDLPLALDRAGLATVSAPHAYFLTYGLLPLEPGDELIELGTGTGYGAALGEAIVAPQSLAAFAAEPPAASPHAPTDSSDGHVMSIEIDRKLHDRARRVLAELGAGRAERISLLWGDARLLASDAIENALLVGRDGARIKIAVTYALAEPLDWLLSVLPFGAVVVAPVAALEQREPVEHGQQLVRFARQRDGLVRSCHGAVRYVSERNLIDDLP